MRAKNPTSRPGASSAAAERRMRATAQRDTPGELALRAQLRRLGLRYRVNVILPGTRRTADVAFIGLRIAVFVDGCFWHGCPQHATWPKANAGWWREKIEGNMARDTDTTAKLRNAGWQVLRFWTHESPELAAAEVAKAVRSAARRKCQALNS